MKIGFLSGEQIIAWHFNAEEITNLESFEHVVMAESFEPDPLYDYFYKNGQMVQVLKSPSPVEPEQRIIQLEIENVELKARMRNAEYAAYENSATAQGILELLIDMEVI